LNKEFVFSEKHMYISEKINEAKKMKSVKDKILARIYGRGRGSVISATDFLTEFKRDDIDKALSLLCKSGTIKRVMSGIYLYPEWSELLQQYLSPDSDSVVQALARKYDWRIQPTGNTALNYLGLSTQVPGRIVYLSDGPSREYAYGNQKIQFKNTKLTEIGLKHRESALVVSALKALGKENVNAEIIAKLKDKFNEDTWERIFKDTAKVTGWIREIILQICKG
jgi:predicted ATP-dependent Lon-type protease